MRQKSSDVITPCVAHHKGFHLCQTRRQKRLKDLKAEKLQSLGQSVGPSSGRIPTRSTTSTPPPLKLSSADPSRLSDLEISLHRRSRKCFKHTALEKVNRTSFVNLRMPSMRYHAFHVLNLPCMIFMHCHQKLPGSAVEFCGLHHLHLTKQQFQSPKLILTRPARVEFQNSATARGTAVFGG